MSKFIIHVEDSIDKLEAIELVRSVVARGFVSKNETQYCYVVSREGVSVYTDGPDSKGSTTFKVYRNS